MGAQRAIDLQKAAAPAAGKSPDRQFFIVLEGMRGAAAIMVMLRHIVSYVIPIQFKMSYLAVDLFFILSGVVIANSYESSLISRKVSFREFAALRLIRIFPLYLVGAGIGLIAMIAQGNESAGRLALFAALAVVMMPAIRDAQLFPLNPPSWSLLCEFFANFLYGKFIRQLTDPVLVAIAGISFACLAYGALTSGRALDIGFDRGTFLFGFARVCFSFFLGVLIYRKFVVPGKAPIGLGTTAAVGILIASLAPLVLPVPKFLQAYAAILAVGVLFPLAVTTALFASVTGPANTVMRWLGELSFPVYVLHAPLYNLSHEYFGPVLDRHAPWAGLPFIIIVIAIALSLHVWIDTPLRARLRKLVRRPG